MTQKLHNLEHQRQSLLTRQLLDKYFIDKYVSNKRGIYTLNNLEPEEVTILKEKIIFIHNELKSDTK